MGFKTAIIGATGAVGQELLRLLDERNFPLDSLVLLASKRSAGKKITFKGKEITVQELTHNSFEKIDLVFSSAGGSISKEFAPSAVKAGAVVIDNTSYYRMDPEVPLIIPEINSNKITEHKGIIANPNCTTILMLLVLAPLHQKWGVKRVVCSTYQAASGAGAIAMDELAEETRALLDGKDYKRSVIPHQYGFNIFAHNSPMMENGYCEEEMKMVKETVKILDDPSVKVSATCIRVPILRAHSESLNIEFQNDFDIEEAYKILRNAEGVEVLENRENNRWPMPLDATGNDSIYVGRLRRDVTQPNSLELWLVGDQILKGAALNAIQIAEKL